MKNVVLIMPPNIILADPLMQINLGVLYLASSLEKAGHNVKIADLRDKPCPTINDIPRAEYYGISATTAEVEDARKIAALIKKERPKTKTIIGGAHPTHFPEDCTADFDYIVKGDGEQAIVDIVRGEAKEGIVEYPEIEDIDSIPFPARHLLPPERVFTETLYVGERYGKGPRGTSIISSRNCPFSCAFCANPSRKVRFRSPENFLAEVKECIQRHNCTHFKIVDDNFTLKKDRTLKMCYYLKPLKIKFRCHTRSALFDDELAEAIQKAGCEEISFGAESADQRVLDLLKKKETVEDHRRAIRIAKEHGLRTKAYFMVATPGETDETIELNKQFMFDMAKWLDKWTISVFCPYPGSDIYKNPRKYGVIWMEKDWNRYWLYEDQSLIATNETSWVDFNRHIKEMREFFLSNKWKLDLPQKETYVTPLIVR